MANWRHARCNWTCFFCFPFPLHRWRCRSTDLASSYCNNYWFHPSKIRPKVSSQKSANELNLQETSEKCAKHQAIAFEVTFVPAFLATCRHTRPLSPAPSGFARRGKTTVFATWIWLHPGPGPSQGGSNTLRPLLEGANILNMAIWMDMDWIEIFWWHVKIGMSSSCCFVILRVANFMPQLTQPLFRLRELQLWKSLTQRCWLQNFHFFEVQF